MKRYSVHYYTSFHLCKHKENNTKPRFCCCSGETFEYWCRRFLEWRTLAFVFPFFITLKPVWIQQNPFILILYPISPFQSHQFHIACDETQHSVFLETNRLLQLWMCKHERRLRNLFTSNNNLSNTCLFLQLCFLSSFGRIKSPNSITEHTQSISLLMLYIP